MPFADVLGAVSTTVTDEAAGVVVGTGATTGAGAPVEMGAVTRGPAICVSIPSRALLKFCIWLFKNPTRPGLATASAGLAINAFLI